MEIGDFVKYNGAVSKYKMIGEFAEKEQIGSTKATLGDNDSPHPAPITLEAIGKKDVSRKRAPDGQFSKSRNAPWKYKK